MGDIAGIHFLVDSWLMSGLLAISAISISVGILGTMIRDKEDKRFLDFVVAPISRTSIVLSYLISVWIIGFAFSIITLACCEAYIVIFGGELLSFIKMLEIIGIMMFNLVTTSSILYFIVTFINESSSFSVFSTIIGTLIGFVTGVYVPFGILPEAAQKFLIMMPFIHGAAAMRQIFCQKPLEIVFNGIPDKYLLLYEKTYGIKLFWGGNEISINTMLFVLAVVAVLFLILSALRMKNYNR